MSGPIKYEEGEAKDVSLKSLENHNIWSPARELEHLNKLNESQAITCCE